MRNKSQEFTPLLLALCMSCSGISSKTRTSSPDSNEPAGSSSNAQNQASGSSITPANEDDVIVPEVVSGVYLTANCVVDAEMSCTKVRFAAKVKTSSGDLIRLAIDNIRPLGIQGFSWDIPESSDYICNSKEGGFAFNPLCSSSKSLAATVINATLTLTANDGTISKGAAPSAHPTEDRSFQGNFMLLDAATGLTPSGATYSGATRPFAQVWQDLVSGVYFTNILYEAQGATNWDKSVALCGEVKSANGTGGWMLPSRDQLIDFRDHGIATSVPVVLGGRAWDEIGGFWSSVTEGPSGAVDVLLNIAYSGSSLRSKTSYGVLCVNLPDTRAVH